MSTFHPDMARTASSQSQAPDTQTIIGLLGNLMPLLLQLQSQYPGQSYFAPSGFAAPDFAAGPGNLPGNLLGNLPPPNPMLDRQAAVEMIEDINANALKTLSAYLENHANQHPGLADCIPIVTQAARAFAARDQAQTFNLMWQAYRAIAMARAMDRELPPPRVGGANLSPSSASILH
jgi:hypothetical protein